MLSLSVCTPPEAMAIERDPAVGGIFEGKADFLAHDDTDRARRHGHVDHDEQRLRGRRW